MPCWVVGVQSGEEDRERGRLIEGMEDWASCHPPEISRVAGPMLVTTLASRVGPPPGEVTVLCTQTEGPEQEM